MTLATTDIKERQQRLFLPVYLMVVFGYSISSYITDMLGMESNAISIGARAMVLGAVLYYWVFLLKNDLFKPHRIIWVFLSFWLLYSFRIIYDTTMNDHQLGRPVSDYYLFAFVLSFLQSIPFFAPVSVDHEKVEKWVFGILIAINLMGLSKNLTSDVLFVDRLGGNEKLNPITYAYLAAWLVIAAVLFILKRKNSILHLSVLIAVILLGIFNLLIAATKSAFIFLGISFILMIIHYSRRRQGQQVLFFSLTLVVVIAVFLMYDLSDSIELALGRFTDIRDNSTEERIMTLTGAYKQFLDSPVIGSFLEERSLGQYPHNFIMEAFMATGIVGGLLFLSFYLNAIITSVRMLFRMEMPLMVFFGLSGLMVCMFSGGLTFSNDIWNQTAIMFGLYQFHKLHGDTHSQSLKLQATA